jgi:hypothetical protein
MGGTVWRPLGYCNGGAIAGIEEGPRGIDPEDVTGGAVVGDGCEEYEEKGGCCGPDDCG